MQFTAIGLSDADTIKYNCGTQESALGGRGTIATVLLMLGTVTSSKIIMDFNSILLNMMAQLLSIYDTDRREYGIAVIELVGLYILNARFGGQLCVHLIIALYNYGYHLRLIWSVAFDGYVTSSAAGITAEK